MLKKHIHIKSRLKPSIAAIILLLLSLGLKAQTLVGPTMTGTPAPGEYYNYSSITLGPASPGFHFTASAGNSLHIYTLPPDCQPLNNAVSTNQNYIITSIPRTPMQTFSTAGKTTCDIMQTVQYIDGLGRPLQTVQVKASPTGRDIVQPIAYDQFGRESTKYLSYTATGGDGSYRVSAITEQASFYTNPIGSTWNAPGVVTIPAVGGVVPSFAQTIFEPSPLNRIAEQGTSGADWQPVSGNNTGHTAKVTYTTNDVFPVTDTANSHYAALYSATINSDQSRTLTRGSGVAGYYKAGRLYVTVTQDENWESGRGGTTEEYKDKDGHVVLKRTFNYTGGVLQFLSIYYVYDDLGNLAFVIPPLCGADTAIPNTVDQNNLCYQYQYDQRSRLVQKKLPGKDWEYMIYNSLDQVIATQDGNQRLNKQWAFTKYDVIGRALWAGLWNNGGTAINRPVLQSTIDNLTTPLWEGTATSGPPTNTAWPTTGLSGTLSVNYYDSYASGDLKYDYRSSSSTMTKGLLTTTKTWVFGSAAVLYKVFYYDDFGRASRTYAQHYLAGTTAVNNGSNYDTYDYSYNFNNQVTDIGRLHYTTANLTAATVAIGTAYIYDHMGRKTQTLSAIHDGGTVSPTPTILSQNDYNEIGQLKTKHLHSTNSGASFMQDIAYTYNERGWLRKSSSGLFEEQLQYNTGTNKQYNGNIAYQSYGTGASPDAKTFTYTYDQLNRLLTANSSDNYNENNISYDLNGNIQTLDRYQGSATVKIDQLSYNYTSGTNKTNQLQTIMDGSGSSTGIKTGGPYTYGYDPNGNVTTDPSRSTGTLTYTYNLLNLPQTITGGKTISYIYATDGEKLRRISTGTGNTDYISGIQYEGTTTQAISFIQTDEGRVIPNGANVYNYEYSLTDHLGNTRVTFDTYNQSSARLIQQDDYYAFGMDIPRGTRLSPTNNYLYNKKELQEELGLYDYGNRFYDPIVARWGHIDRKSELYYATSPYVYALNQPTNAVDPDGNLVIFINGNHFGASKQAYWTAKNYYSVAVPIGAEPPSGYHPYGGHAGLVLYGKDRGFDQEVMNHLHDQNAKYYDGSGGGWHPFVDLWSKYAGAAGRWDEGNANGYAEAAQIIANLARDKNSNAITETIKIITHSMGGAYGNGFLAGLQRYIQQLPIPIQMQIKITLVADFDPFQADGFHANSDVKTQQLKHQNGWNILGMGWLANYDEEGAEQVQVGKNDSSDHSIFSFFDDIGKLSEGKYTWDKREEKWVKQ